MPTMTPADPNGPLMLAWKRYTETADYLNTLSWATKLEHTEGSLWAAFEQGFVAGTGEMRAEVAALRLELEGDDSRSGDPLRSLGLRRCLELQREEIALLRSRG